MLVGHVFQNVAVEQLRTQLVFGLGTQPVEDGLTAAFKRGAVMAVQLQNAELAFDGQDARLQAGFGLEGQVDHALDRQTRRDLDEQRIRAL